jgi:hypothetical protein
LQANFLKELRVTPTKIIKTRDLEVHMMGAFVAVCWNLETKKSMAETFTSVRRGKPFIDFPMIGGPEEDPYLREDLSISGGIGNAKIARQVAKELELAALYLIVKTGAVE